MFVSVSSIQTTFSIIHLVVVVRRWIGSWVIQQKVQEFDIWVKVEKISISKAAGDENGHLMTVILIYIDTNNEGNNDGDINNDGVHY